MKQVEIMEKIKPNFIVEKATKNLVTTLWNIQRVMQNFAFFSTYFSCSTLFFGHAKILMKKRLVRWFGKKKLSIEFLREIEFEFVRLKRSIYRLLTVQLEYRLRTRTIDLSRADLLDILIYLQSKEERNLKFLLFFLF